ncbi:hypothetical protein HMPREF3201_01758 [Megasphaera sp. MJR8396C]|nr:hypothetical protein HMPREF3201_01758 [Megasphaera sp. MJR8396C]
MFCRNILTGKITRGVLVNFLFTGPNIADVGEKFIEVVRSAIWIF